MVNNLQVAFDRATKKYFDQSSSDEDPVLLEYPPIEPTVSRLNLSKEKEAKKEKLKAKDKKHVKQHVPSSDESNNDEENGLKSHHKKFKELKHKDDKKGSHSSDKKKEKSTRGVKRKHKDKDKNDKPKSKKIKKDYTDDENEKFEFDTDQSGSEDDKVSDTKKVKNVKSNEVVKTEKKVKKSENSKQVNSKKKVKSSVTEKDDFAGEKLKKIKKSEKFSKTNEKANNKKRKLEDDSKKNSDSDSNESVQDLITEKKIPVTSKNDTKKIKSKGSEDVHKKLPTPSSTPKKSEKVSLPSKSKKNIKKSSNNEDLFSMSSGSFSRSPSPLPSIRSSALTEDMANSLDCENDTSKGSKKILDSSFRSDTPEIKDKFDLIKERRNKMSQEKEKARRKDQPQAISQTKEKNHKLKETIEKLKIKNEKSKSQIELMDEVLGGKSVKKETSIFDKLKNEETSPKVKGSKKKNESVEGADVPVKSKKIKVEKSEKSEAKLISKKQKGAEKVAANNPNINSKNKKQNKACLDVLDMETEQTLKDINKWLEHTPRFEYSSASNSPSRYMIDEIDMPSKMDDNDFRKPIPLMPSSPSASHSNFQSPTNAPKDFNLLKESNNNKQTALSQNSSTASTSNKKVGSKEPKRKSLKEKLQQLPRKKEVQRTIDRLQPGKTKGNLLHNIQNINKPEELFPLGNREKPKEIKNSLIVQTDESSPKLSLGTVLDTQAFNFNDNDGKKQETDCYEEISLKVDEENDDIKDSENGQLKNEETGETSSDDKKDCKETFKDNETKSAEQNASKPNLNAWFKAFGVPKKPKKSESQDESGKLSDNTDSLKTEGNYLPTPRRLSTGSSISERSSESSPQVGLEERLGAPAPYPSPIGPAPIMVSPKTDEAQKATASNFPNGSLRVGFYQDMTSTKSSPEKSCSPREMPSPYGQYSQQHLYSGASASASPGMYGNFYNPDNNSSGKQAQQASYSKPTNSPASYYDQYKQPLSQESDFNNSMSPSTNPNSPYHSQQTSPYQQQPTSPFQSPSGGTANNSVGNTSSISQAPNSPYSQPNSPYQQPQPQQPIATTFHQSSTTSSASQQHETNPQVQTPAFNNQSGNFSQIGQNASFNAHHRNPEQFSTTAAQPNCPKPSDWNKPNVNAYNLNASQTPNNFNVSSQQPQPTSQNQNPQNSVQHHSQHILTPESTFAQSQGNYNKKPSNEPQSSGTPTTTPLYGTSKLPDHGTGYGGLDMVTKTLGNASKEMIPIAATNKPIEGSKYLDLSKQQTAHINQHPQSSQTQYQQMFDLSNYTKASQEFDMSKSKALDMYNRTMSKNNAAITTPCATGSGFWGNANNKPVEAPANYGTNHVETNKIDLSNKTNSIAGSNFLNNSVPHQQPARTTPSIDINYKQPMFNNPAASSMMDLTAFMRDFRQAEERFSSLSGGPSSFYDKNITPHMFGKNLQPTNSSVALQQMFNNSMTTMAYNREQQNMNLPNYHNRLSSSVQGAVPNANQSSHVSNPQATEAKTKKQRKKKNASPDVAANTHQMQSQNPIQQHHQSQSHQHSQHQQQLAHQQSFQSYGGLKIPAASGPTTDPSAISLKSVVPGSVSIKIQNRCLNDSKLKLQAFNYGPTLSGLYGENPAYLDDFRGTPNPYYPPPPGLGHRSTPDPVIDKTATNPPPAHPQASSSPYHHLLPPHHPSRSSYPFMNSIDPATLQQQYRMMLNQTYQAGYHPALGMQNHWPPHHM